MASIKKYCKIRGS